MAENTKLLYPPDWTQIAYAIKQAHNWTCQDCRRKPPEYPAMHISVHHLDHNTFNNEESNLRVLCAEHHFAYERAHRYSLQRERALNALQSSGQLIMAGFSPYPLTE